ncbi:MAG: cytochrome bc complex cytochrome b subunit [Cyanobacteria bacterium REEB67]|nr:cytochrome bc complex cytochrome b subunit [Cyanobacteria bacterium REEB67]
MKANETAGLIAAFLSTRFPVDKMNFKSMVQAKEVPVHRLSWGYYTGGLTVLFFMIQVATGLLLLFYYQPSVSDANLSVEYIMKYVSAGALIRNMHAWSSSCMIFMVMVHLLTAFAMKAFDKPREITWVTGVVLLLITFSFGFTGYLLPWNQIAVNATKVMIQSIEEVGLYLPGVLSQVPQIVMETFQGEPSVGQATLDRFYALHVVILPFAVMALMGLHLISVQLHGMSQGVDKPTGKTERFFPMFLVKDLLFWSVVFLALFVVSVCIPFDSFLPYPLLEPYNSLASTPPGIKPEWYFYFVYYPLEMLPFWVILVGGVSAIVVLFLTPWIFKNMSRRGLRLVALGATAYLVMMTVFGEQIYHLVKPGS